MSTVAVVGAAGVVAGLLGTITGVGSVLSYPVLLAAGLPPLTANVTNTVALAIGGVGGACSSRPEVVGRHRLTAQLCVGGAVGTTVGSAVLLLAPPQVFELVVPVPVLVAAASVSVLFPRPDRGGRHEPSARGAPRAAVVGMTLVGVYNGYFAAGSSVLIIAALLITTPLTLPVVNGLKNVLVLVSDVAAAAAFAAFGPVAWGSVPPLAGGLLIGSWLGPHLARRLPVATLRVLVVTAGLALAITLGLDAYTT